MRTAGVIIADRIWTADDNWSMQIFLDAVIGRAKEISVHVLHMKLDEFTLLRR
jgi:hypothetical protein